MSFPTFRDMIEPLLRVLAEAPQGLSSRRAQDLVADRLQLSAEEREQRVPGGTQVLFRHRTNWAHDRLKRSQLSSAPRRGFWQLTPKGLAFVRSHAAPFTEPERQELAKAGRSSRIAACLSAVQPDLVRKGAMRADRVDVPVAGNQELSG